MEELDFTLELNSEHLSKEIEYAMFTEAEAQLRELAQSSSDVTGAAINIRQAAHGETTPLHEVTVVVYGRPDHVAATEKAVEPDLALKGALDAVERQIRQRREKLSKRWEQAGSHPVEQEVAEIIAAEAEAEEETVDDV